VLMKSHGTVRNQKVVDSLFRGKQNTIVLGMVLNSKGRNDFYFNVS
jgi:hypothetical protein